MDHPRSCEAGRCPLESEGICGAFPRRSECKADYRFSFIMRYAGDCFRKKPRLTRPTTIGLNDQLAGHNTH